MKINLEKLLIFLIFHTTTILTQNIIHSAMVGDLQGIENALNRGENIEAQDEYGSTPLIIAADRNYIAVVKLLLDRGANPHAVNNYNKTAADYARSHNYREVLILLNAELPEIAEWRIHVDYWNARGGVDWDPARGRMLYDRARTVDHVKADEIALRAPKNIFEHAHQFINDILNGKIPAAFKLKGKLSGEIRKITPMLNEAVTAIRSIPLQFAQMYQELALSKYPLKTALVNLKQGKTDLAQSTNEVENNMMIPQELKDDLMKGFQQLNQTFPQIENVLQNMYTQVSNLVPNVDPLPNQTLEQFQSSLQPIAKSLAQKELDGVVAPALDALLRPYGTLNIIQALGNWADVLEHANL